MVLTDDLAAAITAHAIAAYPKECCGVIKGGKYIKCRNVAADPLTGFRIAAGRMKKLRPVEAVVHSHPDGPDCPSESDMRSQAALAVPFIIVSTDGKDALPPFVLDAAAAPAALIGRGFRHGVTDCYSLIRDWYRMERGVVLPVFPRQWEWWEKGEDLYRQGFREAGFRALRDGEAPAPGDVFLAQTPKSPVINHGGIYLGNGQGLHHMTAAKPVDASRLSRRDALSRWQNYIVMWVRYDAA